MREDVSIELPQLMRHYFILLAVIIALVSCSQQSTGPAKELTAGIVQKEIHRGMSQPDVAESLGSPNIVTRDNDGRESWIYDRIATTASYSETNGSIGGVGAGTAARGNSLLLGVLNGALSGTNSQRTVSQNTFTVVIKFDSNSKVETFSFHQSRF